MSGIYAPHLQRRNGIYHLRMRIPDRLRERVERLEVNRSLKTYSSVKARKLAAIVSAQLQETFEVIEKNTEITPAEARNLLQFCFRDFCKDIDQDQPFVPETNFSEIEILEQRAMAQCRINALQEQSDRCNFKPDISKIAHEFLRNRNINFELLNEKQQLKLQYGITEVLIEQQNYFLHRLNSPLGPYEAANPLFRISEHIVLLETNQTSIAKAPTGITVAQAVSDYLDAKKDAWITKTHKARIWQLGYLIEFLGPEKRLVTVSPNDIRSYRKELTKLRAKHGQGKSLGFFEKLTDNKDFQVKNKTARLIYEPTQAFFRWAKSEEGLIESNPAESVKWMAQKSSKASEGRRPFKEAELRTLFDSPLYTGCKSKHRRFLPGDNIIKDAKYWIPILGYYTGARLGELVQLHIDDVKLDGSMPYLDFNENKGSGDKKHIKTHAGVRQVPLHPDLLSLGFDKFVGKRQKLKDPSRRLFSEIKFGCDGQASTEFSKIFARTMDKVGLTDPTLTFHSFRHGVEDAYRNAFQPQYVIDSIMGHSDGKVSSLYGEGSSLQAKYQAIKNMKLPIQLSHLLQTNEKA